MSIFMSNAAIMFNAPLHMFHTTRYKVYQRCNDVGAGIVSIQFIS